jgi:hypothetical protein
MSTIDPSLLSALVAMGVGVAMVRAGLAKKQLALRPRRERRERWRRR